jgi:hypothetical protein
MSSPTRDELLGYLLGALEPEQHERVADELEQDPELRAAIRKLEACVGRLGLAERASHFDPPANLAARTCQLVAAKRRPALVMRPAKDYATGAKRYTWADMTIAACALIVAGAMLFPAVLHSRTQAQIASCQNNLRYAGYGFHDFSDRQPDGSFPAPEAAGNRAVAGVYAAHLNDNGMVPSPSVFLCPAAQTFRRTTGYRPPTLVELDRATGVVLAALHRMMGGDYGANLGYTQDGQLQRPCNSRRSNYPILADTPSDSQQGRRSANHGGRGQNVLYEDGHVQFLIIIPSRELPDDPYHNRDGFVAAGVDCHDSCLGCSHDRPMPGLANP